MDIYLLDQEAKAAEVSAFDSVIAYAENEVKRLEALEERIMEEEGMESPLLTDIYNRLDVLDPSTFRKRAGELLFGLGFTKETMKKNTCDLSGGWRMRVALATALFVEVRRCT
jgi:ATP-binding cassette subfamily F protein 2